MTWKERMAIVEQKLTSRGSQASENWAETAKIRWLEELETLENELHAILHEISLELDSNQLPHKEKKDDFIDMTNPSKLTQLEACSQRAEEMDQIKKQQRHIMREEKKIVWWN